LAGVAFAVGVLVKITAIFGLGAFVLAQLLVLGWRWWTGTRPKLRDLRPIGIAVASFAGVALFGLLVLDQAVSSFDSPFEHIRHMLTYGAALQGGPTPTGIASNPWDWLVNNGRFDYLRVDVSIAAGDQIIATFPSVRFQGALNPVLLFGAPLVLAFGAWFAVRRSHALSGWALVWIAANYLPFYFLAAVAHRIMYLYYILPVIPALAALTAVFLLRSGLPRIVTWVYLGATILAFIGLFPFRIIPG
jgi:4-amino-4-deoxy-L-arabinose transferase-like glycosyltransferase